MTYTIDVLLDRIKIEVNTQALNFLKEYLERELDDESLEKLRNIVMNVLKELEGLEYYDIVSAMGVVISSILIDAYKNEDVDKVVRNIIRDSLAFASLVIDISLSTLREKKGDEKIDEAIEKILSKEPYIEPFI